MTGPTIEYDRRMRASVDIGHQSSCLSMFAGEIYAALHSTTPMSKFRIAAALSRAERLVEILKEFQATQDALKSESVQLELV
jgi:hypothetical protein